MLDIFLDSLVIGHELTHRLRSDLLGPPLPRRVHKGLDVPFGRRLQHPMTQIQDVHARPAGALDACFDGLFYFIHRTE